MTTANKLTLARVALIPVFLVILYLDFPYARCAAFGVFVVACLTDFVDGYIARHYNQVTNFGKFMDPLADKVLVMAAMCYLVEIGQMPGWALLIVNGLTNLTAAGLLLAEKRAGVTLGGLFGVTLMLWICIQFYMFPPNFILQSTCFIP